MPEIVTLTCPSCGGRLQITADMDRFACAHCGNEHVVSRGGGAVWISPVVDGLRSVKAGVDRTAAELAIRRLRADITLNEKNRKRLQDELDGLEARSNWLYKARKKEIREELARLDAVIVPLKAELQVQENIVKL